MQGNSVIAPELTLPSAWKPRYRTAPHRHNRGGAGYIPKNPSIYRAWNVIAASVLILITSPLMLLISLLLVVTQGRHIFYRGVRLGQHRAIFVMYKFRTLRPEAAEATRRGVLAAGTRLETPLGLYLRATRLDELPQLFNVLRGDMNILGPRPVRPEMAAIMTAEIEDFNLRFEVKPGLIGYTQAVMSHGTSKRIRASLNRRYCRRSTCIRCEMFFVGKVGIAVLARSALDLFHIAGRLGWGVIRERRPVARVRAPRGRVRIVSASGTTTSSLIDISDRAFAFSSLEPIDPTHLHSEFDAVLTNMIGMGNEARTARCRAHIIGVRTTHFPSRIRYVYIASYTPRSDYQSYIIDRYFLQRSVLMSDWPFSSSLKWVVDRALPGRSGEHGRRGLHRRLDSGRMMKPALR